MRVWSGEMSSGAEVGFQEGQDHTGPSVPAQNSTQAGEQTGRSEERSWLHHSQCQITAKGKWFEGGSEKELGIKSSLFFKRKFTAIQC